MSVLSPWTPVLCEIDQSKIAVKVWGRTYTFENSFLPASIEINGNEILSSPIALTSYFGDIKGRATEQTSFVIEQKDEYVTFVSTQTIHNIIINAKVTVEFDGLIYINLSLIPFWQYSQNGLNIPKLDNLYLDIPIKKEFATLFHYWPNDTTSIIPAPDIMNSGALPTNGIKLPFKPYIWSGNEDVGLSFTTQTNQNFELVNKDECIACSNEDDVVNIRINILEQMPVSWQRREDKWIATVKPIDFEIALQATPVKMISPNMEQEWRVYHIARYKMEYINKTLEKNGKTTLETISEHGVKWVIIHENWSIIQNYGLPEDETRFKKLVVDCHNHGIKVMVYFGYEYSTLELNWHKNAPNYLIKTPNNEYTGGWQRQPSQRAFMACFQGGYAKEMLNRIEHAMDEYGVDGIYTDGTYVPWECANESHGCGYRDRNNLLNVTFPVFAVRRLVKQMYEEVHKRGGLIDTHQSSCCMMSTLAFCDSYFDGENIQAQFRKNLDGFLRLDSFRTEYMGSNLGITAQFIAYTTSHEYTIKKIAAITLLHNVFPRAMSMEDLEYLSAIWKAYDKFDTQNATWIPYWKKDCPVKSTNDKVYCSVFKKDDKILLIATNLSMNVKEIQLSVEGNYLKATNIMTEENYTVNYSFSVQLTPYESEIFTMQ